MAFAMSIGIAICIGPVPVQMVMTQPRPSETGIQPAGIRTRKNKAPAISASTRDRNSGLLASFIPDMSMTDWDKNAGRASGKTFAAQRRATLSGRQHIASGQVWREEERAHSRAGFPHGRAKGGLAFTMVARATFAISACR